MLIRAKKQGFFIRCIYVLTVDSQINVYRVRQRFLNGGHDVPSDKVISRYFKALSLLPELISVCDVCHIYDNSLENPFRIFKKRKNEFFCWENELWSKDKIMDLTSITFFAN